MSGKQSIKVIASICLILCVTVVSSVQAEDQTSDSGFTVKQGFYIGAMYVNNSMSGDFDDTVFYTSGSKVYDVPDVDNGTGFGIVLGARGKDGAFELSYQRTNHDTSSSFVDIGDSEATYNIIDLNFKFDVFARDRLRPYLLIGFGFPWLTIEDSMYDDDDGSYDDETFTGISFNLGAGLAYYLDPQWAITGGIIYRWNRFSSVEGKSLDDTLSEKALNLTFGVAYTF
ncbi:MAG: porin family protein [Sedimentisphaerales bacterium]|nr:porin family protein [Sedimentisphaerales bacterium]